MTSTENAAGALLRVSTDAAGGGESVAYWADMVCRMLVQVECQSVACPRQFHGEIALRRVGEIDVSQLRAGAQRVTRTRELLSRADQEYFLINIQRAGRGSLAQDGREALLRPGDATVYSSVRRYDMAFDDAFWQTVLVIPADLLRAARPDVDKITATTLLREAPATQMLASMAQAWFELPFDAMDAGARLHASTALSHIIAAGVAGVAEDAGRERSHLAAYHLRRIRDYVQQHLCDPELSVARVAQAVQVSPAHLHRLFEGERETFSAWVWSCRLTACKTALANTALAHLSISQVAYRHGFNNPSHFSRMFRARFGITPGEWRQGR